MRPHSPAVLCVPLAVLLLSMDSAWGRSTVVAQLGASAVTHVDVAQELALYLRYFPGDGEAICAAEIAVDPAVLTLIGAESRLGVASVADSGLRIDYTGRPLGEQLVDTVQVQVMAARTGGTRLTVRIQSSAGGGEAHATSLPLGVVVPLGASVSVQPTVLYPGQVTQARLTIRNDDSAGRRLEEVYWQWPDGVRAVPATPWRGQLDPGDTAEHVVEVVVDGRAAAGPCVLVPTATGGGMDRSPLPPVPVRVSPGLVAELRLEDGVPEVGKRFRAVYAVRNPDGERALPLADATVRLPEGLEQVEVGGAAIQVGASRAVAVAGPGPLAPGQEVTAAIEALPVRAGLLVWQGQYSVEGGGDSLPVGGDTRMRVVLPADAAAGADVAAGGRPATDVAAVMESMRQALAQAIGGMPADPGLPVRLAADDPAQQKNWVVEDALARVLAAAGYRVAAPDGAGAGALTALQQLHYRLLSSAAVYTPNRGGWNPFSSGYQRQARASVLLSLETPGGATSWARRVRAGRGAEAIPGGAEDWLGGGKAVERVEVPPDFGILEMGMSGLIVGGLLFVFFVP